MQKLFMKFKKKFNRLGRKMDRYQEALTFAEAGEQGHAKELYTEKGPAENPAKLLVVGRESHFSDQVIDYALEMAQRLGYEILALNTAPLSCETFKIFSSSQKHLCQEFKSLSEENVQEFHEKAEKLGIPFTHAIKFCDKDQALAEVYKEFGTVEFVVSDTEEEQAVDRVREGNRPRQEICVYSLL
jgi:hypothetical protein